jgi:hypothetical protein
MRHGLILWHPPFLDDALKGRARPVRHGVVELLDAARVEEAAAALQT